VPVYRRALCVAAAKSDRMAETVLARQDMKTALAHERALSRLEASRER